MANWIDLYRSKLTTPEQAVSVVESGDWIDYGWCVNTPRVLDAALAKRYEELEDVKVRGGILFEKPAVMQVPDTARHFIWNSWHMSGVERKMIADGTTFFGPMRYSELPRFYRENVDPIKAAFFQVSPMDAHGYFTFGPSASHLAAMCKRCQYIFVEVNPKMPRCLGGVDNAIHISQISGIVENEADMWELGGGGEPTEVDKAVANLIVPQIPNGACLQLGIGGMPNAVGAMIAQSDLKDLGVHTEMYVDAFVDIAAAGKITGRNKALDAGRQVYAFGAGTQKLYDYLNDNPQCMSAPVDYTNDVRVVAQLDNFISINNVIELDLFGQVGAETAGTRQISGAGGQLDFVMGAYLSKGGKSFLCCSYAMKGKDGVLRSRIRPLMSPGGIVTDTRANVQYLVTEYGMVNLKGTSTWQRAERIISIAHPDFRDELIREAEALGIWRRSNK